MAIRNIVFDIGNVVVRWDPAHIVRQAFDDADPDPAHLLSLFSGNATWLALNRGELTLDAARHAYRDQFNWSEQRADQFFDAIFASLDLLPGTVSLMSRLSDRGYRLFALTDNVHEIVAHLQSRHSFWPMFEGAAVSAEIGHLKPDPTIYRHLLDTYALVPQETVFFDDIAANVHGAHHVGMHACQFVTADQAERDLVQLGVVV